MAQSQQQQSRKLVISGAVGNVLEWFDFAVYGFFAPVFAKLFFPSDDATLSLIAAYGAFAAGYLMRPLGGAIFGHIGDRYGRKAALITSIILMAFSSLAISLLPTYAQIGATAGILMVLLRMFQGVAVGGEYTGSIVFLAENAPRDRRAFFSCWALMAATGGILLGSLFGAGLSFVLTDEQLLSWGWRVPFFMGVLVAIVAFFIRRHIQEIAKPETERLPFPLGYVFRHHWRKILHLVLLNTGYAVVFYIAFIYVSQWLVSEVNETHYQAMTINSISLVVAILAIPFMASLSDRIGRKPLLIAGFSASILLSFPIVWFMNHPHLIYALIGQVVLALTVSCFVAVVPATLTEMFPSKVRVTAVSVGYNIAFAIFGGTAPMVATWLVGRTADPLSFAWYMIAMAIVSLVAALMLKETVGADLDEIAG